MYHALMQPHRRNARRGVLYGGAVLTALLAMLWLASAVWYVGYTGRKLVLHVEPGRAVLLLEAMPASSIARRTFWESHAQLLQAPWRWWFDGGSVGGATGFTWIAVPLWVPAAATLMLTMTAFRVDTLARRRERMNLCKTCGYDRTGLVNTSVCPECGARNGSA